MIKCLTAYQFLTTHLKNHLSAPFTSHGKIDIFNIVGLNNVCNYGTNKQVCHNSQPNNQVFNRDYKTI